MIQGRLEIILNKWIDTGYVPTPAEVCKEEGIDLFGTRGCTFNSVGLVFWFAIKHQLDQHK